MTVLVATVGTTPLPVYYAIRAHAARRALTRVLLVCSGPHDKDFTTRNLIQPELAYGTRRFAESIRSVLYHQAYAGRSWQDELDPGQRQAFFIQVVPVGPLLDMDSITAALAGADIPDEPVILDYTGGTATMVAAALTWYGDLGARRLGRSYVDATHQVLRYRPEIPVDASRPEHRLPLPSDDGLEVIARLHGYALHERAERTERTEVGSELEGVVERALLAVVSKHDAAAGGCINCAALGVATPSPGAGERPRFEVLRGWAATPLLNGYLDDTAQRPLREFDVVARWGRAVVAVECKVSADRFAGEAGWAIRTAGHVFGSAATTGLVYERLDALSVRDLRVVTSGLQQITRHAVWARSRRDVLRLQLGVHTEIARPPQPVKPSAITRSFPPTPGPCVVTALGAAPLAALHAIHASTDIAVPGQHRYAVALGSPEGADAGDAARWATMVETQHVKVRKSVAVDLTDDASVQRAALGVASESDPVVFDGTAGTKAATIGLLHAHVAREASGLVSRFRVADVRTRQVTTLQGGQLTIEAMGRAPVPWPIIINGYARLLEARAVVGAQSPLGQVAAAVQSLVPDPEGADIRWWQDWSLPLIRVAPAQVIAMTAWDRIVFLVHPTIAYPAMRDHEANACYIVERVALQVDTAAAHAFGDAAVTVITNPWQPPNLPIDKYAGYLTRLRARYAHGGPLFLLARPGRRIDLILDPTWPAERIATLDQSASEVGGLGSVRAAFTGPTPGDNA